MEESTVERGDGDAKTLATCLIENGAHELQLLSQLREKGWENEALDKHFNNQRKVAKEQKPQSQAHWFYNMKKIFRKIDQATGCIEAKSDMLFLDLGCCPGGFSSYVLQKARMARGVGISLPPDEKGHPFMLEEKFRHRYELQFQDLTYFQLGSASSEDTRFKDLPSALTGELFDLAILDGHHLWDRTGNSELWESQRLLLSQIIIGLQSVKLGGTIVVKLTRAETAITAKLMYMFDVLSSVFSVVKPTTMHGSRSTFYAIAGGVGFGVDGWKRRAFLESLKSLWVQLTFGGEGGQGRYLVEEDLNFITDLASLKRDYVSRLIELGEPAWAQQAQALVHLFKKRGVQL